jgi:hypothetical protein
LVCFVEKALGLNEQGRNLALCSFPGTTEKDQMTTKPTTKSKASKAKAKVKPAKKSNAEGTITVLAKENPHAEGSNRHGWFKKLKNGMTVAEAVDLGVRSAYLRRAAARGLIKIAKDAS